MIFILFFQFLYHDSTLNMSNVSNVPEMRVIRPETQKQREKRIADVCDRIAYTLPKRLQQLKRRKASQDATQKPSQDATQKASQDATQNLCSVMSSMSVDPEPTYVHGPKTVSVCGPKTMSVQQ